MHEAGCPVGVIFMITRGDGGTALLLAVNNMNGPLESILTPPLPACVMLR
jgi:hypothetical protein